MYTTINYRYLVHPRPPRPPPHPPPLTSLPLSSPPLSVISSYPQATTVVLSLSLYIHLGVVFPIVYPKAEMDKKHPSKANFNWQTCNSFDNVQRALAHAVKPLRRYRCAACGFDALKHLWHCPGCQAWDSYPARRIEEL